MPSLDAYLFDLDGTLIDSYDLILASYRHTLLAHQGAALPDRLWLAGLGTPLRHQLRAFASGPDELEDMVDTYRTYNFTHHDRMVRPFPGTRAALTSIRAAGARMALVTSKSRKGADRGLYVCGLDDLFDAIVTADDVTRPKPHPEPVTQALELLGVSAARAVFVGDSPHDMASGRAAGVRTAAVLWGPFPRADLKAHCPDHWLSRPQDIASLDGRPEAPPETEIRSST
jgi:pyrophosphatase PpaX